MALTRNLLGLKIHRQLSLNPFRNGLKQKKAGLQIPPLIKLLVNNDYFLFTNTLKYD
jgi:hypothetical protein